MFKRYGRILVLETGNKYTYLKITIIKTKIMIWINRLNII